MPSLLFDKVKNIISSINNGGSDDLLGDLGDRIDSLTSTDMLDPNKKSSYFEVIKDAMYNKQKSVSNEDIIKSFSDELEGTQASQERLKLYDDIRAIVRKIPILSRATRIFVDNILSPDEITKFSLNVTTTDIDENDSKRDKYQPIIDEYKNIIKCTKLDDEISDLIYNVLIEGDRFVEISTLDEEFYSAVKRNNIKLSESLLNVETVKIEDKFNSFNLYLEETPPLSFNSDGVNDGFSHIMESDNIFKLSDNDSLDESDMGRTRYSFTQDNDQSSDNRTHYGFKLDSEDLPEEPISPEEDNTDNRTHYSFKKDVTTKDDFLNRTSTHYDFKKFSNVDYIKSQNIESISPNKIHLTVHDPRNIVIIRRKKWIVGYLYVDTLYKYNEQNTKFSDEIRNSNELIDKLVKAIHTYLKTRVDADIPAEFRKSITTILNNGNIANNSDMVVRFIPFENMQHFKNASSEFDPYGESYYYNMLPILRMYLSRMIASTIYRLARAGKHLLIEVDVTNTHDARNRIEQVKRAMKKREVTGADLSSIDTVFSHISTFEDIYIPAKDGKRMVNIDTLDLGSNTDRSDEDSALLKNILTGIEIPPSLLGIEEFTNSRNTLTQESVVFARSIIRLQSMFTKQLTELLQKIYCAIHLPNATVDSNYTDVIVTFPKPQGIVLSSKVESVGQAQQLISAYVQFGMPLPTAKRMFMPEIDWDKIEAQAFNQKMAQPQGGMGMGGDMGMGMGGMDMGMGGMDMGMGGMDMGGMGGGDMGMGGMDMGGAPGGGMDMGMGM